MKKKKKKNYVKTEKLSCPNGSWFWFFCIDVKRMLLIPGFGERIQIENENLQYFTNYFGVAINNKFQITFKYCQVFDVYKVNC